MGKVYLEIQNLTKCVLGFHPSQISERYFWVLAGLKSLWWCFLSISYNSVALSNLVSVCRWCYFAVLGHSLNAYIFQQNILSMHQNRVQLRQNMINMCFNLYFNNISECKRQVEIKSFDYIIIKLCQAERVEYLRVMK